MKKLAMILLVLAVAGKSDAQTLAEWTQQKKTQLKYLTQQIAAFYTYTAYIKKGYKIVQRGLATIQNIKDGEWDLHKDYFSSLKTVNPVVKEYVRVADIIAIQLKVLKESKSLIRKCKESKTFTTSEIAYVQRICDHLLSQSLKNLDELVAVTTSGEFQMRDDERIRRIEKIFWEMQEKQTLLKSFRTTVVGLSQGRKREALEIELSKLLNNIQ